MSRLHSCNITLYGEVRKLVGHVIAVLLRSFLHLRAKMNSYQTLLIANWSSQCGKAISICSSVTQQIVQSCRPNDKVWEIKLEKNFKLLWVKVSIIGVLYHRNSPINYDFCHMSFVYAVIRKMCPPLAASDYKTSLAKNPHQANCNAGRWMLLLDAGIAHRARYGMICNSIPLKSMQCLFCSLQQQKAKCNSRPHKVDLIGDIAITSTGIIIQSLEH